MKLSWTDEGWEQYCFWQVNDLKMVKKINSLIKETKRSPFVGLGKPEPLKGDLKGLWSRRINSEHRLVYEVVGVGSDQHLVIATCRFHY